MTVTFVSANARTMAQLVVPPSAWPRRHRRTRPRPDLRQGRVAAHPGHLAAVICVASGKCEVHQALLRVGHPPENSFIPYRPAEPAWPLGAPAAAPRPALWDERSARNRRCVIPKSRDAACSNRGFLGKPSPAFMGFPYLASGGPMNANPYTKSTCELNPIVSSGTAVWESVNYWTGRGASGASIGALVLTALPSTIQLVTSPNCMWAAS